MTTDGNYGRDQAVTVIVRGTVNLEYESCIPRGMAAMLEVKHSGGLLLDVPQDSPDVQIIAGTARTQSIAEAKRAADIDGYGDEGDGYDLDAFALELEARGWRYQPKVQ